MSKMLIVTDTTSAMNLELSKKYGIELVPLNIIINGKVFKDQYDIDNETLYQKLRDGLVPTTSQPSTGYIMERMEEWKQHDYDTILVLTTSSDLTGTNHGFHLAKEEMNMKNVLIVDTRSVGAPVMDGAIAAKAYADAGKSIEEILVMLDKKFQNTFSFLYPRDLVQLRKGGRLSPLAATMAGLLKIKPLLYLKEGGTCVDKFGIARTDGKIIQMGVDKFKELNIDALTHRIYISHACNEAGAKRVEGVLKALFNDIDVVIVELPSVLVCHGGLGCISVQSTYK